MKKFLFIFLFAFIASDSFSQNWLWAKSGVFIDSAGVGEGYSVATDASGNVYSTGYFTSSSVTFGTTTLNNNGILNFYLVKYDSSGNVLWARSSTDSNNTVSSYSVATDAMQNVFITGIFDSPTIAFGTFTLTNPGVESVFLVKYDASGNVIWAKNSIGTSADGSSCVTTDVSGNAYITGFFYSDTISFGSFTLNNVGIYNMFLVKYDPSGNVLWAKSAGGTGGDLGESVSVDNSGNVYLTGFFGSTSIAFGTTTLTNSGALNIFLVKFDASGNVLWAKKDGGTGYDYGLSVTTDESDNIYMCGQFGSSTISFGSTTLNCTGGGDVFIVKYDPSGNVLWAKSAQGNSFDGGYSLSVDPQENIYMSGKFYSSSISFDSFTLIAANGGDPMFIVKYDPFGNVLCASALASGGDDNNDVSADRFGNVYITGDFLVNPLTVGNTTLSLTGYEDVFVSKYRCDNNSSCHDIFIPTAFSPNNDGENDFLFVRSQCLKSLDFKIYDRLGEEVFETNDITKGWDGNFRGEKMNNAVFVYFLTGTFNDGTAFSKKGDLSLIR